MGSHRRIIDNEDGEWRLISGDVEPVDGAVVVKPKGDDTGDSKITAHYLSKGATLLLEAGQLELAGGSTFESESRVRFANAFGDNAVRFGGTKPHVVAGHVDFWRSSSGDPTVVLDGILEIQEGARVINDLATETEYHFSGLDRVPFRFVGGRVSSSGVFDNRGPFAWTGGVIGIEGQGPASARSAGINRRHSLSD